MTRTQVTTIRQEEPQAEWGPNTPPKPCAFLHTRPALHSLSRACVTCHKHRSLSPSLHSGLPDPKLLRGIPAEPHLALLLCVPTSLVGWVGITLSRYLCQLWKGSVYPCALALTLTAKALPYSSVLLTGVSAP